MSKAEPWSEDDVRELRSYLEPLELGTGGYAYESDARIARSLATIDARDKTIAEMREILVEVRPYITGYHYTPVEGSPIANLLARIHAALATVKEGA